MIGRELALFVTLELGAKRVGSENIVIWDKVFSRGGTKNNFTLLSSVLGPSS